MVPSALAAEVGPAQTIDKRALFKVVGAMYGLDPQLLEAVAEVESGGRSNAVSPKGAVGLMQLMPATAARFQVSDARDPVENVLGAARYLSYLRDANLGGSGTDLRLILAAYNAGEGAVWHFGGIPPYPETREYLYRVLLQYLENSSGSGIPARPAPMLSRRHAVTARPAAKRSNGDAAALEKLDAIRRARDARLQTISESK